MPAITAVALLSDVIQLHWRNCVKGEALMCDPLAWGSRGGSQMCCAWIREWTEAKGASLPQSLWATVGEGLSRSRCSALGRNQSRRKPGSSENVSVTDAEGHISFPPCCGQQGSLVFHMTANTSVQRHNVLFSSLVQLKAR